MGLAAGITYTFKAQARYSGVLTQTTGLGAGASLAPAAVQPPRLAAQFSGGALMLSWPEAPTAHLESAAALTPPVAWATNSAPVTIVGGQKRVTLTPTGPQTYYRLVLE